MNPIRIGQRLVGSDQPCFIIAEAGVNHNGDMRLAHKLIESAHAAGADSVKFQSFVADDLVTSSAPKARYQVETTKDSGGQYEMLKSLELTTDQQAELKTHCEQLGILYLCTPYETKSIDMLDRLGVAAYKIASTDTTNIPFLRYVAKKGKPVILSTGLSSLGEVEAAVEALRSGGLVENLILLHCTSEYPAPVAEVNLRAMLTMQQAFSCPVGFSDHTPGVGASPWAVAAGAVLIEKHFTLDRNMAGPDHRASLEPDELAELVQTVRQIALALGDGVKRPMPSEIPNKLRMQKSLVARQHIPAGTLITEAHLTCKRPATGLLPSWFDRVVGKRAGVDIRADTTLTLAMIDWKTNG